MPRRSRRVFPAAIVDDVSLRSFADAPKVNAGHTRCSKAVNKNFVLHPTDDDDDECDENNDNRCVVSKKQVQNEGDQGQSYPLDVWALLGNYIWPESVQTFSLLCRDALYVTRTRAFWLNLYKRHVEGTVIKARLPSYLHSDVIRDQETSEVRSRVVQSLFLTHSPLTQRLRRDWMAPRELEGYVCLSLEVERCSTSTSSSRSHWHYRFTMAKPIKKKKSSKVVNSNVLPFSWEALDTDNLDVESGLQPLVHEDEFTVKLELVSLSYGQLPPIWGLKLINVTQGVCGTHFQLQKLALTFDSHHKRVQRQAALMGGEVVHIPNILSIRIFPWFHPHFHADKKVEKDDGSW